MDVEFKDEHLDRLETDATDSGGFPPGIASAYRKRLQSIRAAVDERDFHALRSLHFKKLQGNRSHQWSMRLNDQYRLILELREKGKEKVVHVVAIEDYH